MALTYECANAKQNGSPVMTDMAQVDNPEKN